MRALIELFRLPSAKTPAQRQIEESERQWVGRWLLPSITKP